MEGLSEGQQKALFSSVKNMLADNAPIDLIYKYAPGTKAEIDETVAKIKSLQ